MVKVEVTVRPQSTTATDASTRGATNTMQKSKQHRQGPKKTSPNFHTFQHASLLTQKNKVVSSATLNKDETNFFHSLNLKVSRDIKWHVLYSQLYFKSGTSKTNKIFTDVTVARFSPFRFSRFPGLFLRTTAVSKNCIEALLPRKA